MPEPIVLFRRESRYRFRLVSLLANTSSVCLSTERFRYRSSDASDSSCRLTGLDVVEIPWAHFVDGFVHLRDGRRESIDGHGVRRQLVINGLFPSLKADIRG